MTNLKLTELATVLLLLCACALVQAQRRSEEGAGENENNAPQSSDRKADDPQATIRKTAGPSSPDEQETRSASTKAKSSSGKKQPHIVMIVIDDLGWNDVDWRDSNLHTPVLTQLASQGLVLNQSYVQPVCSPSRAAFMSGFYPYHLGMQHKSLRATQKAHLPANVTTLPQHLKKLGYSTHMAGKWHLGFCNWKYTPTYRGFDSFVGFYNAFEDYYEHFGHHHGYDFRHNEDVYYEANGTYSAFIFTQYIEKVIGEHNVSQPLFVYLPYQSVHGPLQVPQVYIDKFCSHIHDSYRRSKCGMVAVLDEGVGNVTAALKGRGLLNDTLLLITTDNGGPVHEGANNWPLRGSKTTLWEGGTRAMAFLHAPSLLGSSKSGRRAVYDGIIHAVDWLPTLVEAAGGGPVTGLDGVSQWQSLLNNKVPSARTEFLYNMDELKNNSALRQGRFKLLQGNPGNPDGWYPPPSSSSWLPQGGAEAESLWSYLLSQDLHGPRPQGVPVVSMTSEDGMTSDDDDTRKYGYQLYDLEADPNEHHDVKNKYPDVFERMRARLKEYRKSLVPANFPKPDNASLPQYHNGAWSPGWC